MHCSGAMGRTYASSMSRTLPWAISMMARVLVWDSPTYCPTKSLAVWAHASAHSRVSNQSKASDWGESNQKHRSTPKDRAPAVTYLVHHLTIGEQAQGLEHLAVQLRDRTFASSRVPHEQAVQGQVVNALAPLLVVVVAVRHGHQGRELALHTGQARHGLQLPQGCIQLRVGLSRGLLACSAQACA